MAVTKLRGRQTRASEKYDPSGTGLASDSEVEARVKLHSALFHHNRNDVIKLVFDTAGNLSEINTFNNAAEDILYGSSIFTFDSRGNLNLITQKVYNQDGLSLYSHIDKIFTFDVDDNLVSIKNSKIVW